MGDDATAAKADYPPAKSTSIADEDAELAALRKPLTAQASLKAIERRRRRLAWSILRADWARRVEQLPMWALVAAAVAGAAIAWQFGMVARDVRMVASQGVPVVGLGVGAAVLLAVAAGAIGKVFAERHWQSVGFAALAGVVALTSVVGTAVAASAVRQLNGPGDGAKAQVGEPFDVIAQRPSGATEVFSITVVGMVEAPVSDEVLDGTYAVAPVERCWTLVGTADLVQAPGWPWQRESTMSGNDVRLLTEVHQAFALSVMTLGSPERQDVQRDDDACAEDEMWFDLTFHAGGSGPVPFAMTFPLETDAMPTEVTWFDSRGTAVDVSLVGGWTSECSPETVAKSDAGDSATTEIWCPFVVSLFDRHAAS